MILPIIIFVLLGVVCLSSVLIYKMSLHAVKASQQAHERSNAYNQDLLDRLMAMDFNTYKAYEKERVADVGYEPPESVAEVPVELSRVSAFGGGLGIRGLGGGDE